LLIRENVNGAVRLSQLLHTSPLEAFQLHILIFWCGRQLT